MSYHRYPNPISSQMLSRPVILCAGMQSSGTTLLSWSFLQRPDMDGVLDMENSVIHTDFSNITAPYIWVKMTIGSFRFKDVADVYTDLGWSVSPLLVLRDVRHTYSSLSQKSYGFNGTTAEDPPLRMRFRRFLDDWNLFRLNDWPIIKYEDLICNPEPTLQEACKQLSIPWSDAMIHWTKSEDDISYMSLGNETWRSSSSNRSSLCDAVAAARASLTRYSLPTSELTWLENAFLDFNRASGYPEHLEESASLLFGQAESMFLPRFAGTLRSKWYDDSDAIRRIRKHRIFGPVLRLWKRLVNPSLPI